MKFWSSPFTIDGETEDILNSFDIRYKELDEIDNKNDCILIYDTPDNIFNNLINCANSNNQFIKNCNGYVKVKEIAENFGFVALSAWHIKCLSNDKIKKIILEGSLNDSDYESSDMIPKSINPFISILTLGFMNMYPNFLESYIELELSNNLFGRKFDNSIIDRLNLDLNFLRSDDLFNAIQRINSFKINLQILKKDFESLTSENKKIDFKQKKFKEEINQLKSILKTKEQLIKDHENDIYALNDELKLDKLQISFLQKEIEQRLSASKDSDEIIEEYTIQLARSKRLLNQLFFDSCGQKISKISDIEFLENYPINNKLKLIPNLKKIFRNIYLKRR